MSKLLPVASFASMLLVGGIAATAQDPFFATPSPIANLGAATRPFGIASDDFDDDGVPDLVVGRTTGNIHFVKGNGDGTFAAPVQFAWKQAYFNAWAFAASDLDGDGNLDIVWGANAASTGCSVSPIPSGQTCASVGGTTVTVNDGDVRVFYGNGDGTFEENPYFVSGVRHNGGSLIADIGTDTGSLAVGDVDGDGDDDIVAGAIDGTNSVVRLLRNNGGTFTVEPIVSESTTCTAPCAPIYYPAISTQNSPWGLAFGDADGDGDLDLWIGDRALYVYLFENNGAGSFTLKGNNSAVAGRPNVYLGHDAFRAAVGYTGSLAAADVNGDGKADLAIGLHSGAQTPSSGVVHDGEILLDLSGAGGHSGVGALADIGTMARGVSFVDVDGDGALDIVAAEYDGKIQLLRQLPPLDEDSDGISDYVDNALATPNAPRLDMNTDGSVNYRDQLDNDFDTVLGNPELPETWQRLGDPTDPDDDNDGVTDEADNCPFVANPAQGDGDGDGVGDACDPLDNQDRDGDGIPDGPLPGDPSYDFARNAAIKWGSGTTHFVIRIDALGRFFQNEFTQLMTDAATLSPEEWAAKCWENYDPGDIPDNPTYEPCGEDATKTLTLPGGLSVPISLVTIPKQLWTDPPVVAWINDRNDNPRFELAQHATYHVDNTPVSDWKDMPDRNFYSCETCGLSLAENFELLRVGYDTLLGNYGNKWVAESGATAASPKIDWSTSSHQLISFSPPYNTSDTTARAATAQLGFKAFSASVYEEGDAGSYGPIFTPEGSHHEQFDQFGMFHVSADLQIAPPETTNGSYDPAAYDAYLAAHVDAGGLTTWLVEEVDWSGRPCNDADRLGTCNGGSNRENNTVYAPRWNAWIHLLDFVSSYPGGVAMTMGEVAMAKAFDNAPTVSNPDQADADGNGVGDVIDGAAVAAEAVILSRNEMGTLRATLTNGAGNAIAGQLIAFRFDADGDGVDEQYVGTTDGSGVARATVSPSRPVGLASYSAAWDGVRATASGVGSASIADSTHLTLDATNPASGQVTDEVTVGATLVDSSDAPLAGRELQFAIGGALATGVTDGAGHATAMLTLVGPAAVGTLEVTFAGGGAYGPSMGSAPFVLSQEDSVLTLGDAVAVKAQVATATATLVEADGAPLAGQIIEFLIQDKVRGEIVWTSLGTAVTNESGVATMRVPTKYVSNKQRSIRAVFAGDPSFVGSSAEASSYRG